ncbi:MAG: hypothetical protein H6581_26750 [Bacteroidia bacterium]|nr:hypothetical protein [Bacteroidia bacterium]
MTRFLPLILILLLPATLPAQSGLKEIRAYVSRPWDDFTGDPEMHGCCQGFNVQNLAVSSQLSSQGKITYGPENLGDNNPVSAWVEGDARGDGIGEFIEFDYAFDRAFEQAAEGGDKYEDEWYILNGYQKSPRIWQENNRIKTLRVVLNGQDYCRVHLSDEMGVQTMPLGFLAEQDQPRGVLHFRLVIEEVYPGSKYHDTAISELFW